MLPIVSPAFAMSRSLQRAVDAINRDYSTLYVHDRRVKNPYYKKGSETDEQSEDESEVWMPDVDTMRLMIRSYKPPKNTLAVNEALHVLGDLIHCDKFEKWATTSWWAMHLSAAAFVACFVLEVFGGSIDDVTLVAIDTILGKCDVSKNPALASTRAILQQTARNYRNR